MQLEVSAQKKRMCVIIGHELDSKFIIRRFIRAIDLYLDELEKNLKDAEPLIEKLAWGNKEPSKEELEKDGLIHSDLKDIEQVSFGCTSRVLWQKEICINCGAKKGECECNVEHIKVSEEKIEWE